MKNDTEHGGLESRLSFLGTWALAFGCALGWDAFVLPWTTFLPKAGPVGTILGLAVGGAVMAAIAWNYRFMIERHPGPGGSYTFATAAFGADRGFLCGWFLAFAYMAIVWLDATVLSYFLQHATGAGFDFGFSYSVCGRQVGLVHILISSAAIAVAAAACCWRKVSRPVQTALGLLFALCILVCFGAALLRHRGGLASMGPAFAPEGGVLLGQVAGIVALAPWLFVGFETVSHVSGEFKFPPRKSFAAMAAAIASVVVAYALLSLVPALVPGMETGFAPWSEAVRHMPSPNDTAYGTIGRCFGFGGRIVIAVTFFASVFTNLVGNTVAASRLLAAMADDRALPAWLGGRNRSGAPRNAVLAIAVLSVFVFALGETVIGIVVDFAIVAAALAYAYTSAATYKIARREDNRAARATGLFGMVVSAALIVLFVLPNFSSHITTMAEESHLVVAGWCVAGILTFLFVLHKDRNRRFGRSSVAWLVLFAVILFLSVVWIRQATFAHVGNASDAIVALQEAVLDDAPAAAALRDEVRARQSAMTDAILFDGAVQTAITVLALVLMAALFRVVRDRERDADEEKARAKSLFFSTVSHDLRTPLNAIIGFSEMMKEGFRTEEERRQAVDSILVSGRTLLALVNDVLDLSKLESGKMEIAPEPTDAPRLARDVLEAFRVGRGRAGVELRLRAGEMPPLLLDPQRLRQIAFNLLGNAVKFTNEGHVELRVSFGRERGSRAGTFTMAVEDTGCGISPEDLKRIASPYVQVGSRSARTGGTGLGLAIVKQLAVAMGGGLSATSELGKGTTFTVTIPGVAVAESAAAAPGAAGAPQGGGGLQTAEAARSENAPSRAADGASGAAARSENAPSPSAEAPAKRILIVDDAKMNLLVLRALLNRLGRFEVVEAEDGEKALEALRAPGAAPFDLVFTDMWMPRLDGEGLAKAIRADPALARLKVVAVTADVDFHVAPAGSAFDATLLKPITMETLGRAMADCARKGKERHENAA